MTIAVRISACGSGLAVWTVEHVEAGADDGRHVARIAAAAKISRLTALPSIATPSSMRMM